MQIYIHRDNQQLGPFTEAEIKAQLASGATSLQDHVWWEGQQGWVPLSQSPFAAPSVPVSPGSAPPVPSPLPGTHGGAPANAAVPETSKLALWALVCGFVGLLCAAAQILTIILGHLSLSEIKKNPNLKGRSMAITALIVGYATLLIVIVCVVISVTTALKGNVKDVFKTITSQIAAAQAAQSANSADQSATNSDQTTNAPDQSTPTPAPATTPDQSTNSAPAATNTPDQSTNNAPATTTNSTDSSTNSPMPSTNAPDSSTNAAPMSQ